MRQWTPRLSLLLLVPVPSLGVLAGMILFPGSPLGSSIFVLSKLWLFGFPLAWFRLVDRQSVRLTRPGKGGYAMGLVSGVLLAAIILAAYVVAGHLFIKPGVMSTRLAAIGLVSPLRFALGVFYWVAVNSVLEEYVWRGFCVRQCQAIAPTPVAIVLASLFFTLHHTLALSTLLPLPGTLIASGGVFVAGVIWSWMYLRYESIWPGYISHAIADVAIFALGALLAFGR